MRTWRVGRQISFPTTTTTTPRCAPNYSLKCIYIIKRCFLEMGGELIFQPKGQQQGPGMVYCKSMLDLFLLISQRCDLRCKVGSLTGENIDRKFKLFYCSKLDFEFITPLVCVRSCLDGSSNLFEKHCQLNQIHLLQLSPSL